MRLSLLLPCLVMGGLLGVSVSGQFEEGPAPAEGSFRNPVSEAVEEPALPQPQSLSQPFDQPQSSMAEGVVQEEQELRRQYRKLMELKSGLMGRSELRAAINGAVEDINKLRAAEKLNEARVTLLELVKMHPQTKAAAIARAMLRVEPDHLPILHGQSTPTPYEPEPFTAPPSRTFGSPGATFEPSPIRREQKPSVDPANAPFYQQSN